MASSIVFIQMATIYQSDHFQPLKHFRSCSVFLQNPSFKLLRIVRRWITQFLGLTIENQQKKNNFLSRFIKRRFARQTNWFKTVQIRLGKRGSR